jgi:hypothetical protein
VIGPVLGAVAAAATYLFVMDHARQALPAQAPEVGESATPPGGAVPLA